MSQRRGFHHRLPVDIVSLTPALSRHHDQGMLQPSLAPRRAVPECLPTARGCGPALVFAIGLIVGGCSAGSPPDSPASLGAADVAVLAEIMAEEDQRPPFADASAMRAGLTSDNPLIRRFAARGLGRLEEPAVLAALGPTLADPDAAVRSTVADAIAQSVFNDDTGAAADLLRGRLVNEPDPAVRGALAQALGRLRPYSVAALEETQAILIDVAQPGVPVETLVPALRGLESLARTNRADIELTDGTMQRLTDLTRYGRSGGEGFVEPADAEQLDIGDGAITSVMDPARRVRRLALAALDAAGAADADTIETALYDRDVEVRRLAAIATGHVDDPDQQRLLLQIVLADADGKVRYEGLRWYSRRLRLSEGCAPIVGALEDDDPHVALQAIDLLVDGCRGVDVTDPGANDPSVPDLLLALVATLPGLASNDAVRGPNFDGIDPLVSDTASVGTAPVAWHAAAHALTALAGTDPDAVGPLIAAFRLHPTWQVRMYAARAAATVGAIDALEQLAQDTFPNVATAALRGLDTNLGDAADGAAVAALASDDYQLLISAADMLEATEHPGAMAMLTAALERVTLEKRETSRDPRSAILERIGELGDADRADEILPYLEDFDPRIAAQTTEILLAWTGTNASPSPAPLPLTPFPGIAELLDLQGGRARMEMQGGGIIEIELYPFEAPTNVVRFARQAREGYFEGLTFHRVVANFVIQGGSPGANEYVGDGPYVRDEVGDRSHLRGTVGISTRGRDTGDAQIFINLVDNVRLDHNYTIIGTVVSGMDIVDAALEGATIERVTIEPGTPR